MLLGRQGAGKGTQAGRLAEHFGIVHLSTGELFRAAARAGTAFGLEAKRYMDGGELLPDEIVVGVVEERFADNNNLVAGFVLDGFPRTAVQARELDRVLGVHRLDLAIQLEVPTEIVMDRLSGRRVCVDCGATYHVNLPPKRPWSCDQCGADVVQREDDTESAVLRRLEIYDIETLPLLDFYACAGLLVTIDGVGDGDAVFSRLIAAVGMLSLSTP